LASEIIKNADVSGEGRFLTLTAPLGDVAAIVQTVVPPIQAARDAAKRVQSKNNLREIALALLNYKSEHGHFPPSVLYDKNTGTPYSWRVAILPYMEQNEIYKQYRFNEPWDSKNNKKVLESRPMQLLSPTEPTSTNTAYFALLGPETAFPKGEVLDLTKFTDGTSDTILVVEAKRNVPWTKPEDIPYSSDKPLPKLGGWFKGVFNTAFCDGSVHQLSEDIAPKTLRSLIERADGNAVDRQEFQR